jgi:hypothetical protein
MAPVTTTIVALSRGLYCTSQNSTKRAADRFLALLALHLAALALQQRKNLSLLPTMPALTCARPRLSLAPRVRAVDETARSRACKQKRVDQANTLQAPVPPRRRCTGHCERCWPIGAARSWLSV